MKGFVSSSTRTITDENGIVRVRTESKQFVYKSEEDPFYSVFLSYVKWMFSLSSAVAIKVLLYMLSIAEFNTGRVSLTTGVRSGIMDELGIKPQSLSRAIRELTDNNAVSKDYYIDRATGEQKFRKGEYVINPQMFWKGDLKKRKELIVEFKAVYDDQKPLETDPWETSQ